MLSNIARLALVMIAAICAALGIVGCGEMPTTSTDTSPCNLAPNEATAFAPCGGTKDGVPCAAGCFEVPDNGGVETPIADGCMVSASVGSTTTTFVCVSSCGECQ